ncbi:hypothetical protein [Actinocorallia aurantiaca]|uniref:Uncharacterized protein n=1 Tax=Actinocorallia aurantiaca TaxID=46204 RepID=A0ABN3U8H7_9ACTN
MTAVETVAQSPEDDGRRTGDRAGSRKRWAAAGAAALAVTAAVALTGAALGMRPEAVLPPAAGAEITISSQASAERRAGGTGGAQAFMPARETSEDLGCDPGSGYRYKG